MPRPLGETPVMRTREGVRGLEERGLRKGERVYLFSRGCFARMRLLLRLLLCAR
jgi:hypothetical protein